MSADPEALTDPNPIVGTDAILDSRCTETGRLLHKNGKVVIDDADKVEERCGTPGDLGKLLSVIDRRAYRPILGTFAERLIILDYCMQTHCQQFREPITGGSDFFDDKRGSALLVSYLGFHNPQLTNEELETIRRMRQVKHGQKRPDILTHKENLTEFYEIKPDSKSGRDAGIRKIGRLVTFFEDFGLPYWKGDSYIPTPEIAIATVTIDGIPVELFLRAKRIRDALITYQFCIRGDLREASLRAGKKVRKLALLGFIIGVIIPIIDPILEPSPQPVPAQPLPIPAEIDSHIDLIMPKRFNGITDEEFSFYYVRGLPKSLKGRRKYDILISFYSNGLKYFAILEFRLVTHNDNIVQLESTNRYPLNIAPTNHSPLIIKVKNKLTVNKL
ncbi:hypothetical protein [Teredinibacter waterburyi]|uniref:hypothetical protein n=1 Tax=Teredinibacter waterburyi TaxID=1500538 RepID=UPI00165F4CF2|nr:hypothetical protein [Teredinibacter waterburyi]